MAPASFYCALLLRGPGRGEVLPAPWGSSGGRRQCSSPRNVHLAKPHLSICKAVEAPSPRPALCISGPAPCRSATEPRGVQPGWGQQCPTGGGAQVGTLPGSAGSPSPSTAPVARGEGRVSPASCGIWEAATQGDLLPGPVLQHTTQPRAQPTPASWSREAGTTGPRSTWPTSSGLQGVPGLARGEGQSCPAQKQTARCQTGSGEGCIGLSGERSQSFPAAESGRRDGTGGVRRARSLCPAGVHSSAQAPQEDPCCERPDDFRPLNPGWGILGTRRAGRGLTGWEPHVTPNCCC